MAAPPWYSTPHELEKVLRRLGGDPPLAFGVLRARGTMAHVHSACLLTALFRTPAEVGGLPRGMFGGRLGGWSLCRLWEERTWTTLSPPPSWPATSLGTTVDTDTGSSPRRRMTLHSETLIDARRSEGFREVPGSELLTRVAIDGDPGFA